jgi:hypothetical protein
MGSQNQNQTGSVAEIWNERSEWSELTAGKMPNISR